MTNYVQIQQRHDTSANWTAANPVLLDGEIGVITDVTPRQFKIGDGNSTWNVLPLGGLQGAKGDPGVAGLSPTANQSHAGFQFIFGA